MRESREVLIHSAWQRLRVVTDMLLDCEIRLLYIEEKLAADELADWPSDYSADDFKMPPEAG